MRVIGGWSEGWNLVTRLSDGVEGVGLFLLTVTREVKRGVSAREMCHYLHIVESGLHVDYGKTMLCCKFTPTHVFQRFGTLGIRHLHALTE